MNNYIQFRDRLSRKLMHRYCYFRSSALRTLDAILVSLFNNSAKIYFSLILLTVIFGIVFHLRSEMNVLWISFWWFVGIIVCILYFQIYLPKEFWIYLKNIGLSFYGLVPILSAALIWISSGIASNELNQMFGVSASLLRWSSIAFSFAIAATWVGLFFGLIAILVGFFAYFVNWFIPRANYRVKHFLYLVSPVFAGMLAYALPVAPVKVGYANYIIGRIALEFDFDDKILCTNAQIGAKYLFLDTNRMWLLEIIPADISNMTPVQISKEYKINNMKMLVKSSKVILCKYD